MPNAHDFNIAKMAKESIFKYHYVLNNVFCYVDTDGCRMNLDLI
jgi:hypothetical protein